MSIKAQTLTEADTLRTALAALEHAPTKICVVVGTDGRLLRTVTDGDVRRALLSEADLDTPISALSGRHPVTMPVDTPRAELIERLDASNIDVVILVDDAGRPMRLASRTDLVKTLFLSPPHMGDMEAAYVKLAFDENFIAPAGTNLSEFEKALCRVSGQSHALAVSSGTAGLHLALRVLDVADRDRVYVSDMTFAASVQPILYERAQPVLIDCDPDSWNMSPQALARALEHDAARGTLPKAIIVVHLYGQSADMDRIMALADRYGIPVIEDAAESLGARWQNAASGSHGLIGVYSFNGNKIITTSGGGAMVSNRKDLIDRARALATQGRDAAEHYQHSSVAYNYRMSNVLAGIGRGQLEVLHQRVEARRAIFGRYQSALADVPGLSFQTELERSMGNRWLSVISIDPDHAPVHPYVLMHRLRACGMETRPAWKPMSLQPLMASAELWTRDASHSVAHGLFHTSLCLPSGSSMHQEEQAAVIDIIRDTLMRRAAA